MSAPFFAHMAEAGAKTRSLIEAAQLAAVCQPIADSERRNAPHMDGHTAMSDAAREELIAVYGQRVQECMANAHGEHRATWLSFAQIAQHRMYRLINGRSAAQVARLEEARGLA